MLLLSALFLFGCSHHDHDSLPKESNVEIVENLQGNRWDNIYFSGQPAHEDLKKLKAAGFSAVINLRSENEKGHDEVLESKTVESLGLKYYNIPMSMKTELSDKFLDSITSKVVENRKEGKVLIHCSSGNRVGLWLGAHLKKDHQFSDEKSLTLAKELGINRDHVEERLKSYLKTGK